MSMFCIEAKATRERHGDNSDEKEKWGKNQTHTLECSPSYVKGFFRAPGNPLALSKHKRIFLRLEEKL